MIFDSLANADLYKSTTSRMAAAFEFLKSKDFSKEENGKVEIDGKNLYAIVNSYNTIPCETGKWECHKNYIDIQFIADGEESIGYTNVANMQANGEYNPEKDVLFLKGEGNYVTIPKGSFAVFFPHDAHKPNLSVNESVTVKKVVVKVKID